MRKAPLLAVLALALSWSIPALGQPGAEPYPGSEPVTRPAPPVARPAPPLDLRLRAPLIHMTADERDILLRGEIGLGRYITGGILSYAVGFGIGQGIQGRWTETGWLYTFADVTMLSLAISGLDACAGFDRNQDCTRLTVGLLGLVGSRIVQVIDAWVVPPRHNRRVRELKARYRVDPYAVPYRARLQLNPVRGGGVTGGVGFSF